MKLDLGFGAVAMVGGGLGIPAIGWLTQAAGEAVPGGWESLGMGGLAIALAMWMVRESTARRIEAEQAHAAELKEQGELHAASLKEQGDRHAAALREQTAAIERIYTSKVELQTEVAAERRADMLWIREHLDSHITRDRAERERARKGEPK